MDNGKWQHNHNEGQTDEKSYSPLSLSMKSEKLNPSLASNNYLASLYTGRSVMNAMGGFENFSKNFSLYSSEMKGTNLLGSSCIPVNRSSLNAFPCHLPLSLSTVPLDFTTGIERNGNSTNCFLDQAEDIIARNAHFLPKSIASSPSPQQRDSQVKRKADESVSEDDQNEVGSQENREPNIFVNETDPTTSSDSNDSAQRVQQQGKTSANELSKRQSSNLEEEETYRKKRDKNNAAAKRSRDKKKQMEQKLLIVTEHLYKKYVNQEILRNELTKSLIALRQKYDTLQEEIQQTNLELIAKAESLDKTACAVCTKPFPI